MSKEWEYKLNKVLAEVMGNDYAIDNSELKTTSDSELSSSGRSANSCEEEERRIFMEMYDLLDETLHSTMHILQENKNCQKQAHISQENFVEDSKVYYEYKKGRELADERDDCFFSRTGDNVENSLFSATSMPNSPSLCCSAVQQENLKKKFLEIEKENKKLKDDNNFLLKQLLEKRNSVETCNSLPIKEASHDQQVISRQDSSNDGLSDEELLMELINTKHQLAQALSDLEEERHRRHKMMKVVDNLLS